LGERAPEDNRERDRRQPQAERAQAGRREDEKARRERHENRRFARRHRAARKLAQRGPRGQRVIPPGHRTLEAHPRASSGGRRDESPADFRRRERRAPPREQRSRERERQREHRMTEADERKIGG